MEEIDKGCGNCKWLADCELPLKEPSIIVCKDWEDESYNEEDSSAPH